MNKNEILLKLRSPDYHILFKTIIKNYYIRGDIKILYSNLTSIVMAVLNELNIEIDQNTIHELSIILLNDIKDNYFNFLLKRERNLVFSILGENKINSEIRDNVIPIRSINDN